MSINILTHADCSNRTKACIHLNNLTEEVSSNVFTDLEDSNCKH